MNRPDNSITLRGMKKTSRMRLFRLRRKRYMRHGINQIPNLFTLGNAFFGFCSLVLAAHGESVMAAYFVLLGALMDALDGRMARLLGVTSSFGMQLDSLCDLLSFIVAPAFLVYTAELKTFGIFGFAASSLFVLAGATRLARFNITTEDQAVFFLGVPSTIAGCFIATTLIMLPSTRFMTPLTISLPFIIVTLAYLMISRFRFPTFKHLSKKSYIVALLFISGFIISMGFIKVLFTLFLLYFCSGFGITLYNSYSKHVRSGSLFKK